jgi:hypothetical protein
MNLVDRSNTIDHNPDCIEQNVELFSEAEESLLCYLAGWLIRKCSICRGCQDVLIKPAGEHSYCRRPVDIFIDKKRFIFIFSFALACLYFIFLLLYS